MIRINPFHSPAAVKNSSYCQLDKTSFQIQSSATLLQEAFTSTVAKQLREFLLLEKHSCLLARSTIRSGSCRFGVYENLASGEATAGLSHDLFRFLKERPSIQHPYASFIAVFKSPRNLSEERFEDLLWKQLSLLNKHQQPHFSWDKTVSSDPEDPNWSFSFGGKGFYVVGMHKNSSRLARQFPYPMLIFNLHEQFEELRAQGKYDRVKKAIRKNELNKQGSINPMLQDFGEASEARQYSGREVSNNWKCPFHSKNSS